MAILQDPPTSWRRQSANVNSQTAQPPLIWRPSHGIPRPNLEHLPQGSTQKSESSVQVPHFSLAGNPYHAHGPSYVPPDYHELNPRYQRHQNAPMWGLAKPLPRVVRPGMRRERSTVRDDAGGKKVVEDTEAAVPQPGSSEAIPQLGMIGNQRYEAGKEPKGLKNTGLEGREYGNQQSETSGRKEPCHRHGFKSGLVGIPVDEKSDPMENLKQTPANDIHYKVAKNSEPSRPSSFLEVPSHRLSRASTASHDFAYCANDTNQIDLEGGLQYNGELPVEKYDAVQSSQDEWDNHNSWASFRAKFREPLAECLATMIAVLIGICTNLAVQTSNGAAGDSQSQNWAWGLGITIGIYIAGGVSGGHLNPVISLMLCLYRGFPFRKALVYIAAQLFGGFLAALIAYGIYHDAIINYNSTGGAIAAEGGSSASVDLFIGGTGKSFFTQPASFAGTGASFANEFVATAILACAILALGDDSNAPPGAGMHALIVGLVVFVLTLAFGYTTGACLNPARDFGPRVVTVLMGYGGQVFSDWNGWWIYGAWGATISGGLIGGLLYDVAVFVGGESPVNYPRGRRNRADQRARSSGGTSTGT